jgi:hypothetical protein
MIIDWYNLIKPTRLEKDSSRDHTIKMGFDCEIYLLLCWSIRLLQQQLQQQKSSNDQRYIITAKQ